MMSSYIVFWILAIISVGASIMMVTNVNPVRSALYLVLTLLTVAVLYITLAAQFIAAVQVIVYAGAIMVLFLFVIMLLNLGAPEALRERGRLQPIVAVFLAGLFVAVLIKSKTLLSLPDAQRIDDTTFGTVETVGHTLFNPSLPWLFPFEVTSILLLAAIVGAIIMAKRRVN